VDLNSIDHKPLASLPSAKLGPGSSLVARFVVLTGFSRGSLVHLLAMKKREKAIIKKETAY
jgi:hypothetical protein